MESNLDLSNVSNIIKDSRKTLKQKFENGKEDLKELGSNLTNAIESLEIFEVNQKPRSGKSQQIVDLNVKLSNGVFSSTQAIADKNYADWEKMRKKLVNSLQDFKETSLKINELGKNYYELVANFEELKFQEQSLPNLDINYCVEILRK